jgi:uncharacterized protein (TIGR00369 family)
MHPMTEAGQAMLARALGSEKQEFGSFFLSRLLGFAMSYTETECIVTFTATPGLFNPQGTLHGGVLATAMDVSMGHLLNKTARPGATLEMKVQYLAAITGGQVRCVGSFLKQGRSICFLQSQAFREDGELCACATATWRLLPPG